MNTFDESLAGVREYGPGADEPVTLEKLEEMIAEMRSSLQNGFALIESVWARCLGNRDLAASIDDKTEFEEIEKAAEKLGEIAGDIHCMAMTGTSFVDNYKASHPPVNRKECFGSHPGGIESGCLPCPDESDCGAATGTHTFDDEYDEVCDGDPEGKK